MGHSRISDDEIERRGEELSDQTIRTQVETEENIGKICAIDIETGEYEIHKDLLKAVDPLHAKHPGAAVWVKRIGHDAVFTFGGSSFKILEPVEWIRPVKKCSQES